MMIIGAVMQKDNCEDDNKKSIHKSHDGNSLNDNQTLLVSTSSWLHLDVDCPPSSMSYD